MIFSNFDEKRELFSYETGHKPVGKSKRNGATHREQHHFL